MKNNSYELWFYDVWGNEEDGFSVNDRYCVSRDFIIPTIPKTYNRGTPRQFTDFVPSDKEVLTALVKAGEIQETPFLANINIDNINIDGVGEHIYLTEENGYPLCELLLNESEKIDCDHCRKCGENICGNDPEKLQCFEPIL